MKEEELRWEKKKEVYGFLSCEPHKTDRNTSSLFPRTTELNSSTSGSVCDGAWQHPEATGRAFHKHLCSMTADPT